MGEKPPALKVVLDTNIILSALLFEQGRLTWIRKTWEERRFAPLCSAATADEIPIQEQITTAPRTIQPGSLGLADENGQNGHGKSLNGDH